MYGYLRDIFSPILLEFLYIKDKTGVTDKGIQPQGDWKSNTLEVKVIKGQCDPNPMQYKFNIRQGHGH